MGDWLRIRDKERDWRTTIWQCSLATNILFWRKLLLVLCFRLAGHVVECGMERYLSNSFLSCNLEVLSSVSVRLWTQSSAVPFDVPFRLG